jgi:hypothetical protein
MNTYLMLEIATEVAFQLSAKDSLVSRCKACDISMRIINEGVISNLCNDVDEFVAEWLHREAP